MAEALGSSGRAATSPELGHPSERAATAAPSRPYNPTSGSHLRPKAPPGRAPVSACMAPEEWRREMSAVAEGMAVDIVADGPQTVRAFLAVPMPKLLIMRRRETSCRGIRHKGGIIKEGPLVGKAKFIVDILCF